MRTYKVVKSFSVRDAQVLELDEPWEFGHADNMEFVADGKVYKFTMTHHESWIIVRTDDDLNGKIITVR